MGMTIEEAIEIISDIDKAYRTFSNMEYEAMQKSIDTMRKYQKIEEAYKKYLNDMVTNIYADKKFIVALRGILEDGNDR